ncbi:MAG: DNA repair protein RecO [Peptoniphilaceae bacterium]|nr:DNA repair protein RecO [Peptoniphilaceae bacterium]MDD7383520.1 DNA repair protein RecO [Peptoniphilaceae bacterium]MDY3738693.1 DNA repair protein RecO [Peptoniphilaceae bacterium]
MDTSNIEVEGIVLREFKYKESSKIIEILTEKIGKISILCKGVLRKNSKNLTSTLRFSKSRYYIIHSKNMYYLKESFLLNSGKNNFNNLVFKSAICDLILKTYKVDEKNIYELVNKYFLALDESKKNSAYIFLSFLLKYISFSGYMPSFDKNLIRNKNKINDYFIFSISDGKIVSKKDLTSEENVFYLSYNEYVFLYKLLYTSSEKVCSINFSGNIKKMLDLIVKFTLTNLEIDSYSSMKWAEKIIETF